MSKRGDDGFDLKVIELRDRPLAHPTAMTRIRLLWRDGKFTWGPHVEERLTRRRLDMTDVENIIRYGTVVEHSKPGMNWRYKIDGPTVEQKRGGVACEIDGELLVLVSVMLRTWRT